MRLPKLRELKEAVTAVLSPRFTTRFPAEPCVVPQRYRGKPRFDLETCVGCGACVNVCPTSALTLVDSDGDQPVRQITLRYDTCIFCANCADSCTTQDGIALSNEWDLAGLERQSMAESQEYDLVRCEKCAAVIGTRKHLLWLCDRLGPLAYANPSLLLARDDARSGREAGTSAAQQVAEVRADDFMRLLCPHCRYELNVRL